MIKFNKNILIQFLIKNEYIEIRKLNFRKIKSKKGHIDINIISSEDNFEIKYTLKSHSADNFFYKCSRRRKYNG